MKTMPERNWKALTLLSIIVPVSLLATFKLTGIIQEPLTISQTITADLVTWNMSRPTKYSVLLEKIENSYVNGIVSANLTIVVGSYHENEPGFPSEGNDYVKFGVIIIVNASAGFIHSINLRFSTTDAYAVLYIYPNAMRLEKLKPERVQWTSTDKREAYIETVHINQPKNCSLETGFSWVLFDKNNMNHSTNATLEVVYFDGGVYHKVVMPTLLVLVVS